MAARRPWGRGVAALLLAAVVFVGGFLGPVAGATPPAARTTATTGTSITTSTSSASTLVADPPSRCVRVTASVRTIALAKLPSQARDVLRRIVAGGPFRYRQDGSVFQNRERRLPSQPRGYYEEYTVETPGSPDRGARRIIAGECGDRWYTADHYRSFRLVVTR